nr:MAG TPA: hypothetical protein [Bacteriophage sp.]
MERIFRSLKFSLFPRIFRGIVESCEDFYHKPELCNIETISNNIRR